VAAVCGSDAGGSGAATLGGGSPAEGAMPCLVCEGLGVHGPSASVRLSVRRRLCACSLRAEAQVTQFCASFWCPQPGQRLETEAYPKRRIDAWALFLPCLPPCLERGLKARASETQVSLDNIDEFGAARWGLRPGYHRLRVQDEPWYLPVLRRAFGGCCRIMLCP
jgi:hypothetical protein